MTNRPSQSTNASEQTIRASISFPELQYLELERIARSQRVSLAWVVRDAVEEYLKNRWPLFETAKNQQQDKATKL